MLPETLATGDVGSKVDVEDLGNGVFAVSNTVLDGTPQLLVVGTADPTNLAVAAIAVPAVVHGVTASNGLLYATTEQGLSIYQIGQLVSVPVTVSVEVADQPAYPRDHRRAGSYNTAPDQTTPGTNFDTVVWNRALAFGNTSLTFTWQTALEGLAAGETQVVAQDATVDFVSQATSGTIDLPERGRDGRADHRRDPGVADRGAGGDGHLRRTPDEPDRHGGDLRPERRRGRISRPTTSASPPPSPSARKGPPT